MSAFRVSAATRGARPRVAAWLVSAAACAVLAAMPADALASNVSISGSTLFYSTAVGEVNTLRVTKQMGGALFEFSDSVSITPTAPCLPGPTPRRTAICPTAGIGTIIVYGGQGDDTLDLSAETARATVLMGGAGNDTINGGPGIDQLFGEDGDDTLDGGAGSDTVNGGLGTDTITGGADSDQLSCGEDAPAVDTVSADSSDAVAPDCAGDAVTVTKLPGPPDTPSGAMPPPSPATPPAAGTAAGAREIAILSPFPIVRLRGAVTRTGARIELLAVQAPRGSRVAVSCLGRGCPARRASAAAGRGLRFKRFQRHLRAGVVLEVRVTQPGRVGKYVRFTIRRGKSPLRRDMCVRSNAKRPVSCSSI